MKTHLDIAHKELERVSKWIENADTKSSILLALNGGLLALWVGNTGYFFATYCWGFNLLTTLAFLGATAVSVHQAVRVLLPDVQVRSHKKLFFFGTIKTLSSEEYAKQFSALSEEEMTAEILEQVHINSTIAANKFGHLKTSVTALAVAVIAIFLMVLLPLLV